MAVPTTSQVTGVANTLLRHAGLRRSVHGIEQCGSVLFSQLYEALTGSRPPGGDSEAQRCQAVVDAFSDQLSPHVSLNHIRGSDLAARDPLTILHLLDVFSVLFDQPSMEDHHHPPQTTTDRDASNFISPEGLGIVSEVLREKLGHTHCHTHFSHSYSTNSTEEILRPVSQPHLPLHMSHPHSSQPPPSLTITSLTSSTLTEHPAPEPAAYEESTITCVPPGAEEGPLGRGEQPLHFVERQGIPNAQSTSPSSPSTPPSSQRQPLFSSPLHHSTPRTMAARSRLCPDPPPPTTSHPLTRVTFPLTTAVTATLPPSSSSPPHPLTESTSTSESEGEAGAHTMTASAATQPGDPPTADQVDGRLGTSLSVQLSRNEDTLDLESDQDTTVCSNHKLPPSNPQPHEEIGPPYEEIGPPRNGKLEEVRKEVLASLYQRYLKELQTSQFVSPKKSPASRRGHKLGQKKKGRSMPLRTLPIGQGVRGKGGEEEKRAGKKRDRDKEQMTAVGITSDLFPLAEASLPVCPLATETVHHLWRKQLHQITTATKPTSSHPHNISHISEMERKHTALLEAIKKEIDHTRRMHGQQEAKAQQCAVKSRLSAKRQAAARARRYFNDYELKLKAKLQKKRTSEEQVFRQVFEDGLAILRERERELRRFAREKKNKQIEKQRQQLDVMEQYYRDRFSMLAESLAREREGAAVRDKAQHQLAEQLRRELRERLEREVRQLQDCLDREDDVTHFRELDAQRLRQTLQHILRTH